MNFRSAEITDIVSLHKIRMSVKENILNNPLLVTEADYKNYLTIDGKGWLCEIENQIVGFAIINTKQNNIWALFIHPSHEKKGIGKKLQNLMLNWFFSKSEETLWLSTATETRAELFYRSTGWKDVGRTKHGEIKFEMSFTDFQFETHKAHEKT